MPSDKVISVDSIVNEVYGIAEAHVTGKVRAALAMGEQSFEVCDSFGFAVTLDLRGLKAALRSGFDGRLHAVDEGEALLESMGCFASMRFSQKPKYCAARVKVWAPSAEVAKKFEATVRETLRASMVRGTMFGVHWAYMGGRGLDDVYIEETFEDDLLDVAYPALDSYGGVQGFVDAYLASDESVLILQGPPGGGKTRLVRKILAEMSRRAAEAGGDEYGSKATALYTGDARALESDEIFARFVTGEERAFVVEDADHMLKGRNDGNDSMHRFLAIADGIVRAGGRKVIFTTNLPNIGDVDEALVRAGRCFAQVSLQALTGDQAKALGAALGGGLSDLIDAELSRSDSGKTLSLAKVYALAGKSKAS